MLFFYLEGAPANQHQVADWFSVILKTQLMLGQYKAPAATCNKRQVTLDNEAWFSKGHDKDPLYSHVP